MPSPSYHARRARRVRGGAVSPAASRRAGGVALVAAALACGRDAPTPARPSAPPVTPVVTPVTAPAPPPAPTIAVGWDAAAGTALLVPGPSDDALLVLPGAPDAAGMDTAPRASLPTMPADAVLLGPSGLVGRARLAAVDDTPTPACAVGPRVRVGPASGADAVPAWTVGLVTGGGAPPAALPLRALDAEPGADSAVLAAALTRLAAALPEAPGVRPATRAALRGVPFRVRQMRGFAPDSLTEAVVAVLTRTMNQEAAPAADAVLLVAERPASGANAWRAAFVERATGPEEQLPATAVLAAVRLPGSRAALVTAREGEDGTRYALLERAADGTWRSRWTSARPAAGCAR